MAQGTLKKFLFDQINPNFNLTPDFFGAGKKGPEKRCF